MQESRLQESVVKYIAFKYPKIRYCASLGGIRTSYKQALLAKRTGYIKGFPDLQICIPNKKYCGLFLELKVIGRYATKEQKEWISYLNGVGYKAEIVKGIDNAIDVIDGYLNEVNQ
tara:strand:- start:513 stop:860 length:348 start_codon:yes stop_codon:yes gene_type:complete